MPPAQRLGPTRTRQTALGQLACRGVGALTGAVSPVVVICSMTHIRSSFRAQSLLRTSGLRDPPGAPAPRLLQTTTKQALQAGSCHNHPAGTVLGRYTRPLGSAHHSLGTAATLPGDLRVSLWAHSQGHPFACQRPPSRCSSRAEQLPPNGHGWQSLKHILLPLHGRPAGPRSKPPGPASPPRLRRGQRVHTMGGRLGSSLLEETWCPLLLWGDCISGCRAEGLGGGLIGAPLRVCRMPWTQCLCL